MSKGMTNASIDSSAYRWIGKELGISFKRYFTVSGFSSGHGGNTGTRTEVTSFPTFNIEEQDRRYGYYHGKRSYTTGDVISTTGTVSTSSVSVSANCNYNKFAVNDDEYFMFLGTSSTATYPVTSNGVAVFGRSPVSGTSIEVGAINDTYKVYLGKMPTTPIGGLPFPASTTSDHVFPLYTYDLDEFDMVIVEGGGSMS